MNPHPMANPGRGNYWVIAPNKPKGNKREVKRNKEPWKRILAAKMKAEAEAFIDQMNPLQWDPHLEMITPITLTQPPHQGLKDGLDLEMEDD